MELTSSKKIETNKYELLVKVNSDEFKPAVDRAFRKRLPRLNVPGFRKGKAPKAVVYKMFGEGMFYEDAVNELYPKAYKDAVKEADLTPVAYPQVEITSVDGSGFTFKAIVVNKPEVTVRDYKGINARKVVKTVKDGDIDEELERLRKRNARILTAQEREAKEGDIAVIDFEGFIDGTPFQGGKGENHNLKLGSGQFIPGFEDQVVGHKPGDEFDVNVTFPEQYKDELKGKEATFKVVLHELKEEELPELDDEFAKDVSEFDTLAELREDIRKKMQQAADDKSQENFETALVDTVIGNLEGEIPDEMIEAKMDEMMRDYEYRLRSQGISMEQYMQWMGQTPETFRGTFQEPAGKQVRIRLALEKIAEMENIVPTQEEIDEEYERVATQYRSDAQKLRDMIPAEDISADVAVGKAIDLIRDSAVVTEVSEEQAQAQDAAQESSGTEEAQKPKAKAAASKDEDGGKPKAARKPRKKKAAEETEETK